MVTSSICHKWKQKQQKLKSFNAHLMYTTIWRLWYVILQRLTENIIFQEFWVLSSSNLVTTTVDLKITPELCVYIIEFLLKLILLP